MGKVIAITNQKGGVGKTTTVGKLAGKLKDQGKRVVIAGADTFRAAAGDQLKEWANRSGVDMIGGVEGADPGSVVYDATAAAKARNADVLICGGIGGGAQTALAAAGIKLFGGVSRLNRINCNIGIPYRR